MRKPDKGSKKEKGQREALSLPPEAYEPRQAEGFDSLAQLALDMRWSFNHSDYEVWRKIDPVLWDLTGNPWVILQTASRQRLESVLSDPAFRRKIDHRLKARRKALETGATWFERAHPRSPLTSVAYFSMEFMLSEALPIYSGGLGNVAGDQLKAASDLGVPVVGIGLLYQQGYFRQVIDKSGAQQAFYPYNDPSQLPITPLREPNGEWLRLKLAFPGCLVWLRTWQVQVGRVRLYLMDSNDPANFPPHRGITGELYAGGPEQRLMQEMVLGMAGWRLMEKLGIKPEVCHLNEGHAAFAVLERARSFMKQTGLPFDAALACTRAGNVFTTHTPVAAGFDRFHPSLIEQYLGGYATNRLGIPVKELLALGRENPEDSGEFFNMAYLAVRGSRAVGGVSRLHGEVSRRIFQPLFPRWPQEEVPVGSVTNGVHMPTWDSAEADELWTRTCGKKRWEGEPEILEQKMSRVSDASLWEFRNASRLSLIKYLRQRLIQQLAVSGAKPEEVETAKSFFDPGILTIGFARRFAAYKRPTLLLEDQERLLRLLNGPGRPVQLIVAGKAHPADGQGQDMIRQWTQFVQRPDAAGRAVFLSDYDMMLTARLVQGVDVWINTPRRPWEACGTSGMKVLVNGGLNLSELDGWWAEAYAPEAGWAVGDGKEHDADPAWDAAEAVALYELLEQKVVPCFYTREKGKNIPVEWVSMMRESMARLTTRFSADRAVAEYAGKYYVPAAGAYQERAQGKGAPSAGVAERLRLLKEGWPKLRFGGLEVRTEAEGEDKGKKEKEKQKYVFEVRVFTGGLDPGLIRVELYAEGINGGAETRHKMERRETGEKAPLIRSGEMREALPAGEGNGPFYTYTAQVPAKRPAADYTARIIPEESANGEITIAVPLEAPYILWQR